MINDIEDIYIKSAMILERAQNEILSDGLTELQYEFLSLKFKVALIHNDFCREIHNLNVNPTTGASKLLSYGPIILKLFEANRWYIQIGNKRLLELAKSRNILELVENNLKDMKKFRPSRIEEYARIRNKLAGHYDDQINDMLKELGEFQADVFFEDIEMMVRYGQEWLCTLRSIGKLEFT
jgi:hypothetical protein